MAGRSRAASYGAASTIHSCRAPGGTARYRERGCACRPFDRETAQQRISPGSSHHTLC